MVAPSILTAPNVNVLWSAGRAASSPDVKVTVGPTPLWRASIGIVRSIAPSSGGVSAIAALGTTKPVSAARAPKGSNRRIKLHTPTERQNRLDFRAAQLMKSEAAQRTR